MRITSPSFGTGEPLPTRATCDGEGVSPELHIHEPPPDTKSFALIADDPDAPGGTFVHWLVWNIPASAMILPAGKVPEGSLEGSNSDGDVGYHPACPPEGHGLHHYHFRAYALDGTLDLVRGATRDELQQAIHGRILDEAELIGTHTRR